MKTCMRTLLASVLVVAGSIANSETIDISGIPAYPDVSGSTDLAQNTEAKRDIVLLDLDLLEIAGALGAFDRIVARPRVGDLEVPDTIPHVFKERPGVEGIMAMRPAVVIASNPRYNRLREQLEQLGVKTMLIDQSNPANEKVMHLASVLGMEEQGEKLSTMILSDYEAVASKLEEGAARKLIHVSRYGSGGNFSVGGMETPVDNLIRRVGAENPAAAIGLNRYRRATQEGIIQMRPDAILFASVELDTVGDLETLWSDFPGLTYTPAGKHQRIVLMRNMHVRADAASSGIATTALFDALQKMFP